MTGWRQLLIYAAAACLSGIWWGMAAGVCHAVAGRDPIDLLTATQSGGTGAVVSVAAVMMFFIAGYAFAGLRFERWRVGRSGG